MSTQLAVGDLVQARMWTTAEEQAAVNSWWYLITATSAATDADFAEDIDSIVHALVKAHISSTTNYNGVQAQIHRGSGALLTPFVAAAYTGNSGTGTLAGPNLPRQAAGLTGWYTAKAGTRYRGRTYWPFPNGNDDTGDGVPAAGYVTDLQTVAEALLAHVSGTAGSYSCSLQLFHRGNSKTVPPIPYQIDQITSATTRTKWATQRRRGSYGRANTSPI